MSPQFSQPQQPMAWPAAVLQWRHRPATLGTMGQWHGGGAWESGQTGWSASINPSGPSSWHHAGRELEARKHWSGWHSDSRARQAHTPRSAFHRGLRAREASTPGRRRSAGRRGRERSPRRQGELELGGGCLEATAPALHQVLFALHPPGVGHGLDCSFSKKRHARQVAWRRFARGKVGGSWLCSLPPSADALQQLYLECLDLVGRPQDRAAQGPKEGGGVRLCDIGRLPCREPGRRSGAHPRRSPCAAVAAGSRWEVGGRVGIRVAPRGATSRRWRSIPIRQPFGFEAKRCGCSWALVVQSSDDTSAVPGEIHPEADKPPVADTAANVGQGPPQSGEVARPPVPEAATIKGPLGAVRLPGRPSQKRPRVWS